jgi:hypothetical protein
VACDGDDSNVDRSAQLLAPRALDRSLVFVDKQQSRAYLLDVVSNRPSANPRVVDLAASDPTLAEPRNRVEGATTSELLVLCAGRSDDGKRPAEAASLVVLDESGWNREYPLEGRFDALAQSADGRYAVLFYDAAGGGSSAGDLLFSPNQIAIIDLESASPPTSMSLTSFGESPRRVVFSPEMTIGGQSRRLAVALMDSAVSIVDVSAPNGAEISVPLTRDNRGVSIEQVVFDANASENKIYLRGASPDIYVVQLTPGSTESGLTASLNLLGTGVAAQDMTLAIVQQENEESGADDENQRLLAVSDRVLVIDADSSRVTDIALTAAADRILLFEGAAPEDEVIRQRALLYKAGSSAISFLNLREVEERRGRNVETIRLPTPYSGVVRIGTGVVLLLHGTTGVSLLDLSARTVSPISSRANLQGAIYDADPSRLWLTPRGDDRVGFVDVTLGANGALQSFVPHEVRLDGPVDQVIPMTNGNPSRVVVTHPSALGYVTILDGLDPTDLSRAVSLRGFVAAGVMD